MWAMGVSLIVEFEPLFIDVNSPMLRPCLVIK